MMAFLTMAFFTMAFFMMAFFTMAFITIAFFMMAFITMAFSETHRWCYQIQEFLGASDQEKEFFYSEAVPVFSSSTGELWLNLAGYPNFIFSSPIHSQIAIIT